MARGTIVIDVDGTITRRDCKLSSRSARLLRGLIREEWRVFVLTGRSLENVEPRVLDPIRAISPEPFELGIFTCEGARRWNYNERGASPVAAQEVFAPRARDEIGVQVNDALGRMIAAGGARMLEEPSWWEESLLVFKVAPATLDRGDIIRDIQARVPCSGEQLRVGAAGRTTIVVTRSRIHKGAALGEIRGESPGELPVLYLADEFEPPGNDAVALEVPGILCVSVGAPGNRRGLLADLGGGPAGAYRFLSSLERLSHNSLLSGREIITLSVGECAWFSPPSGGVDVAGQDVEKQ